MRWPEYVSSTAMYSRGVYDELQRWRRTATSLASSSARSRRSPPARRSRTVASLREHVLRGDDCEFPAVSKQARGLLVAHVGIDPVECGEGADGFEALAARRLPALEGGGDDPHVGEADQPLRAIAASSGPRSMPTISSPGPASGTVARPVPQPISSRRRASRRFASVTRSARKLGGG